jgi:tetratricopeptide (TPR) repeat protein
VIRCKKAQAVAKPFNQKKRIKAGMAVVKKLADLLDMTREADYGDLTAELELLDNMVANMQKGVLEPLLESLETIERRMSAYHKALSGDGEMNQSTQDVMQEHESQHNIELFHDDGEDEESLTGGSLHINGGENLEMAEETVDKPEHGVTAVQQRFMDRLSHFFDFQRIAEERTAIIDPQGKIAAMKVKPHSKGIEEKDGTFKAGYRQQDIKGKPIRHLTDLYIAAEMAQSEFKNLVESLGQSVVGFSKGDIEVAPIKQRARASQKAQEEYTYRIPGPGEAWLYDVLRASVICKSYKQMSDVNKFLKESVHIVDCQNRFATPQFDGYRDILYYVSVPYKDELAFICEIQVHHKEFKKHFGVNSHKAYFRPYFAGPFKDPVESLRDMDMLLQVGRVDDNLLEFLLEATDSNQLKLFARVFFEQLEETDRSLDLFKRVLTMEESSFGKGHVITGSTYQYLGRVLLSKGDADGALLYLAEAISVFTANLGSEHPEVATTLSFMGEAHSARGDFAESLREQKKALDIREEALGDDHLMVAESYLNVAKSLCDKGEFKKGMAECRTALIIQESILGEKDIEVTKTHCAIGRILFLQGETDKALESYNVALAIQEEIYGKKHQRIADTLTEIGNVKMGQGKLDEAETYHRKALQMRDMILGKEHPDCAVSYSNLGFVLSHRGDKQGALVVLRLALKIRIKALGRSHLLTSNCYSDMGAILVTKKDLENALKQYNECLTIRKGLYGRNHPKIAEMVNATGRVKSKMGDQAGALSDHEKALAILQNVVGSNHPDVADTYQYMGETHETNKNLTKALENHSKALGIRSAVLGKQHPATASSCVAIAEILEQKGDLSGAKMAYRQALAARLSLHGEIHADTADVRLMLGRVLNSEQDFDAAEQELRKALSAREEILGADDLRTAEALSILGTVLNRKGEFGEALILHQRALDIRIEQLGENHPLVIASREATKATSESKHEDEINL